MELKTAAKKIIDNAIRSAMPGAAVQRALEGRELPEKIVLVSIGKAAWHMAKAAADLLRNRIEKGIVITKYDHVVHPIEGITM